MRPGPAIEPCAAILVGGRGTRFGGGAKPEVEIDGERVIDRAVRVVRERCHPIAIVSTRVEVLVSGDDIVPLVDVSVGAGPLAGIAAALAWAPVDWVLIVAGDLPLLSAAWIDRLLEHAGDDVELVAARCDDRPQPLAALYHRRCADAIAIRLSEGRLSPMDLFKDPSPRSHVFDVSSDEARAIRGFNTEDELDAIRRLIERE